MTASRNKGISKSSAFGEIPPQLRSQARLATALLLGPWLATLILCWPLVLHQPLLVVTLLPGLLVATRLQRQLWIHLGSNHRPGEADLPFPTLGAANWITLARGAALVALAGFLPLIISAGFVLPPGLLWAFGLTYLGVALADLMDGFLARRQHRETELGQRLDIETDAAGLLTALLAAVFSQRLPAFTLLVGLAYYVFVFGIRWRQKSGLPLVALQSRPYARIIAGFQIGLVGLALLPLFNPTFTFAVALLVMAPLLGGFVRDWLVVSCRLPTDAQQHTALDRRAGRILTRFLPLVLRLIVLAGGTVILIGGNLSPAPFFQQALLGLCCLLAGLGFLGRSSALLLTLWLSSILSPFGASVPALVLLGAAATLMLTGTGPLSLWSPEERILYRRQPEGKEKEPANP